MLAFWNFRQTGASVVRQAFSVGSLNDFSWRNRLVAYEGALQIMAARPWSGFGWGRPTEVFDQLFKPSRLVEPPVIQLNDYSVVGMTLGLPALVCFVGYVALSLRQYRNQRRCIRPGAGDGLLRAVCQAGFIVLAVGFWLDRGLFFLALTTPFWILLELGYE